MAFKVIIVEGRPDVRSVLKSVMKNIGIKNCMPCANLQEAIPLLSDPKTRPDWLISSLDLNEKINALQALRLTVDFPELQNLKVSLTIDKEELPYVPSAFELGAVSYHVKPFSQQSLENEFSKIFERFQNDKGHEYLVAADYLKKALVDLERFEDLLHLEKRLVNHFPKQAIFLLNLAEAYFLNGDQDQAVKVLSKARFLGDNIRSKVVEVMAVVAPGKDVNELEPFAVAFGVNNAFIIDRDSMESKRGVGVLKNLGLQRVEEFQEAEAAMNYLYDGEFMPDLIVMEWKLGSISGAAFVQRLTSLFDELPPIIVTSSSLNKADHLLLHEIGASYVLEKPYRDEELIRGVFEAVKSTSQPTGLKELMHKLKEASYQGNIDDAKEAHGAIVSMENIPDALRATADGLWFYLKKDYMAAKDSIVKAIKESKDSVLLVDLLGKTLMNLNQKDAAIRCFMKASHISPLNLERLCSTAELCSESGQSSEANEMLDSARHVDKQSDRVILAESRVALNLGDTKAAQEAVMKMGNLNQLISYMNNRAVVMVKDEQVEAALNLYDDALTALPEDRHKEKSVILFNKGLALARLQKGKESIEVLAQIGQSDDPDMYKKAQSLLSKIESMVESGKAISFAKKVEEAVTEQSDRPVAMHVFPGQLRLHLIFECPELMEEHIRRKLTPLSFHPQSKKSA